MLQFIVTNHLKHEIVLVDSDDEKVRYCFEYKKDTPDVVSLQVNERFMDYELTTFKQLKIDGHVLSVVSCYAVDDSHKKISLNEDYPYIIFPRTKDEIHCWDYMYDADRKVKCKSKITTAEIGSNVSLRILQVWRDIEYLCLEEKGGFVWEEFYIENVGLIKRIEKIY